MKFAYFVTPHVGGTWTVFQSVRRGLATYGITLHWIGVGPEANVLRDDPQWVNELNLGSVAGATATNDFEQAIDLIKMIESENYDGVFVNAACNRVHSNVVRYLSPHIIRIMTVHSISVATYEAAAAIREWIHATITVSPRIQRDLIKSWGFSSSAVTCIPNAVELSNFNRRNSREKRKGKLRVLSLGRIIDIDKGILWLPRIMDLVNASSIELSVAGEGPDLEKLMMKCAHLGEKVKFLNRIPHSEVPAILSEHDVFIFPSRFEGLGLSLVEAMASGCVPIASKIHGVTDFVVTNGQDGFLFEIGDTKQAANYILNLDRDRELLYKMSREAQRSIEARFDLSKMSSDYLKIIENLKKSTRLINRPLKIEQWSYPKGLRPKLRSKLPEGLKKFIRLWRERLL